MKVGVIGGGIVGSAIAASIKKNINIIAGGRHSSCSGGGGVAAPPPPEVVVIDDQRPNQTSQAGQGYLWSIHRCRETASTPTSSSVKGRSISSLEYSLEAKQACRELLGQDNIEKLFDDRGSMLVAPTSSKEELLSYYDLCKDLLTTKDGGGSSHRKSGEVIFLNDASIQNDILLPSICGILYKGGDDYTCSPPSLISCLVEQYDIKVEYRTVTDLNDERKKFDYLICCTGPWINELKPELNVKPIRGVLLEISTGKRVFDSGYHENKNNNINDYVPMMEYGYGSLGLHFTLSSRNQRWLLGASREEVSFSTDGIEQITNDLIRRSNQFLREDVIGDEVLSKIGFRPYTSRQIINNKPFQINCEDDDRTIFCYGFEGQGVLYAAIAAKEIVKHLSS